jgi:FkbM family methyltransferase
MNNMLWLRFKKIIQIIQDPFLVSMVQKGTAAGTEHILALRGLNCEYIVDIGANRGQFAVISRKIFPLAKIHSFEPLEEPAKIFKRIFSSDPNITLHTVAIGRERTTATIHVTREDDSSSLLPITEAQSGLFPGATEKETRQVAVLPLSEALGTTSIPPASLLKIDVQGYEMEVLKGCEDLLDKFAFLYIECSFVELYKGQALAHQVIAWLDQREFVLSGVHNMFYGKKGRAVQGDFLFTHQNRN